MSEMAIFDPAMCCSTGVCRPSVDPELLRVAAVIENLKKAGIEVARYNLSSDPQAFVRSKDVSNALNGIGVAALPITTLDGKIAKSGSYPTDEEFASLLGIPLWNTKPVKTKLTIEWQHLDVEGETCNRCYDTGENLAAEIKRLYRTLNPQNIEIEFIDTKLDGAHVPDSNTLLFTVFQSKIFSTSRYHRATALPVLSFWEQRLIAGQSSSMAMNMRIFPLKPYGRLRTRL